MKPVTDSTFRVAVSAMAVAAISTLILVGATASLSAEPPQSPDAAELWFFFSPDDGDLAKDVAAMRDALKSRPDVRLRPCLLVSRAEGLEKPSTGFAATVGQLYTSPSSRGLDPGLRILDEEGLVAARSLGIEALPAFAVVEPPDRSGARRARVAVGRGANLKGLLSCK